MENEDDDRRKFSFSYDVGGEKLRLIDVSKEDDFLIDSPLFDSLEDLRLSVSFDNTNEYEANRLLRSQSSQQGKNEQNLSPFGSMEPARPSYLRKSLAWDSAFFNSAGVLDPDELTFINKGLQAVEDIRKRKAETKSTMNGLKKSGIGHQNKTKTTPASQRHRIQRSEKIKTVESRREDASLKPSKASETTENLPGGQSTSGSLHAYNLEIEKKTASISGKDVILCKKSSPILSLAFSTSTNDNAGTLSPHASSFSCSSWKDPSCHLKGKTDSRKSKLRASTSTPETAPRPPKNCKELANPRFSEMSLPKSTSRSRRQPNESEHLGTPMTWVSGLSTPHISQRKSSLSWQFEEIKSPDQMNTEALAGTCPISTEPRKKFKPSGLRQPSPKLGFFDEEKTISSKANESLQFHHGIDNTSVCDHQYGSMNRKRPAKLILPDNTSPKTKTLKQSWNSHPLNSAPGKKLWNYSPRLSSTMKSWSDVAPRQRPYKCTGTEGENCSKSMTADPGCARERDGQRQVKGTGNKRLGMGSKKIQREVRNQSAIEKMAGELNFVDKQHLLNEEVPSNLEEQINDLSKYFDVIDLSNGVLMEFEGSKDSACKTILDDQHQELPNISPNPSRSYLSVTADILPGSRTPLADKTSICNRNGSSIKSPGGSTKGRLAAKASTVSCFEGVDKENA